MRFALCAMRFMIGGSFNGRTTDSDSVNRGSSPRPPANFFNDLEKPPFEGSRIGVDFVT